MSTTMRLLVDQGHGSLSLVEHYDDCIPRYAILSHTWGADSEEVTFKDLTEGTGKNKAGYNKIEFCGKQAASDNLQHFWVDTCCIDKSSSTELTEAINSMFRWYKNALRCYVYPSDVSTSRRATNVQSSPTTWEAAFRRSRWFSRGWTLQELIAPVSVEFFSREGDRLGSKRSLEQQIHDITGIAIGALRGEPLTGFEVDERLSWANYRETNRKEDKAYSLLGIFDIHMTLLYGEGREKAFVRLRKKIDKSSKREWVSNVGTTSFTQLSEAASPTIRTSKSTIALTIAQPLDNTIRLLAVGRGDPIRSVKRSVQATDVSMTTDCVSTESAARAFEEQLPSSTSSVYSDLERTVDGMEATWRSMEHISDTLKSFVQKTQAVFISEDRSFYQHLARIYRDLGRTGSQIQQLRGVMDRFRNIEKGRLTVASHCGRNAPRHMASCSKWDDAKESDRSAIEIFFDCVSRFSADDSSSSIDSLHVSFVGSLGCRFESEALFYPGQYTLEGLFCERVFAVAMKQSRENRQTMEYFLMYAETPRRWQRVILSTTFHEVRERSGIFQFAIPNSRDQVCLLPSAVQRLLRTLLPCIKLDKPVMKLCVSLREDAGGDFIVNSDEMEVTEDDLEVKMSEKKFLEEIDAMNCDQFVESDVVVQWWIQSNRYKANVGSQQCFERKVPFASAGRPGENAFQNFLDDIKLHIRLRSCSSVVKFVGVVLDDNRLHLRSFLLEYPILRSLELVLGVANFRSETIPWPIREAWARQIINAIVDVHSRGVVLGALEFNWFGVRADGTAVVTLLKGSRSHLSNRHGQMPPELRNTPQSDGVAARKKTMNFRTDVFQLGLILWLLVEHKPKGMGYFCARSVCTYYPRYKCEADHSNPVELPEVCGRCPPYLREIIRLSRSQDPKARPSARKLAEVIEGTEDPDTRTTDIEKLLRTYATARDSATVYCDECGALTTEDHFQCNICNEGDFDICQECYAKEIRCYDSEHLLTKHIMRNDRLVDVS